MSMSLAASYRLCETIARRSKSNFYYTFYLLPRPKRRAMCALYAFLRRADDLGDAPLPDEIAPAGVAAERRRRLDQLRTLLVDALAGRADDPALPALADTVRRYAIPVEYLHAAIDGVGWDLERRRFQTFADLEQYCYRVASVVGLACIHIWGFRDNAAFEPAKASGIAFQLTNILRDLQEDAVQDRCYLPLEDLQRFQYDETELRSGTCDERFVRLMDFQIARAERFYCRGQELNRYLLNDGRRIFSAMTAVYHGLLLEIKRRRGDVLRQRVRLSRWQKAWLAARSLLLPLPRQATATGCGPIAP